MLAHRASRGRGAMIVELAVALTIIAMIAAITASGMAGYAMNRDHYFWRRAAAWAAEAQLRRYQAGARINSKPPDGTVAGEITLTTRAEPGAGQWSGFQLVTVTATVTRRHERALTESASCYIPIQVPP